MVAYVRSLNLYLYLSAHTCVHSYMDMLPSSFDRDRNATSIVIIWSKIPFKANTLGPPLFCLARQVRLGWTERERDENWMRFR